MCSTCVHDRLHSIGCNFSIWTAPWRWYLRIEARWSHKK